MAPSRKAPFHRLLACAIALCSSAGIAGAGAQASSASRGSASDPLWHFVSAPGLQPPKLQAEGRTAYRRLQRGYFLITDGGALVLDSRLRPVWFRPGSAQDLKLQRFEGKPVLTWWEGKVNRLGIGTGTLYAADEHYRLVAHLNAARGWSLDPHDAVLSGHDAWVVVLRPVNHVDLRRYGGSKDGMLFDNAVQEYDLRSGRLLRTWDALNPGRAPHVPLSDSVVGAQVPPWDPYHINSLQLVGSHGLLVSMRDTSSVYLVDLRSGKIVWTLGGKHSSFRTPRAARFHLQHDVLLHRGGIVTMFDNRCCALEGPHRAEILYGPTRALVLKLRFKRRAVSLVHQYLHTPPLHSDVWGSLQELANGNVLVGWGAEPYFSEYNAAGKRLLDMRFEDGNGSYRVLSTSTWVGMPSYPPSAALQDTGGVKTLYVSWNGATQVAAWQVLVGSSTAHLSVVARKRKIGFETAIRLPNKSFGVVRVKALNTRGRALGSRTLTVPLT